MIEVAGLETLLEELEPIGLSEHGTTRLAWTAEDAAAREWFERTAAACGLRAERDAAGNLWACPDTPPPWWAVGSHLDSVREGGRFDGALGVLAGFAVARASSMPLAVISFADEEGARFNTPTFGSRALAGMLNLEDVLHRRDADGIVLADAMRAAGVDHAGLEEAPAGLERLRGLLELHIDQSRDVDELGVPAAVVSGLAARLRMEIELTGVADHAGTTRRAERRDAMLAAARVIEMAYQLTPLNMVTTVGRVLVEPNAPTTVAARVRLWVDARAPTAERLNEWMENFVPAVGDDAARLGVESRTDIASYNDGITFNERVRDALGAEAPGVPELVCFAGHDAGVIGTRRPAGMVLVRNESGVSHAPEERVELEDAAAGARMVLAALERLA